MPTPSAMRATSGMLRWVVDPPLEAMDTDCWYQGMPNKVLMPPPLGGQAPSWLQAPPAAVVPSSVPPTTVTSGVAGRRPGVVGSEGAPVAGGREQGLALGRHLLQDAVGGGVVAVDPRDAHLLHFIIPRRSG